MRGTDMWCGFMDVLRLRTMGIGYDLFYLNKDCYRADKRRQFRAQRTYPDLHP